MSKGGQGIKHRGGTLEVLGSISSKEKQRKGLGSGERERQRAERLKKIEGGKEGR